MALSRRLDFSIPEWKKSDFEILETSKEKLEGIKKRAGSSSSGFEDAMIRLMRSAAESRGKDICDDLKTTIDVRAFFHLINESDAFAKLVVLDEDTFSHILRIRSPLSRLSLTLFIRFFLTRFDLAGSPHELESWSNLIILELSQRIRISSTSDLSRYFSNRDLIFNQAGPSRVARYANENKIDLQVAFSRLGLIGYGDGRFVTLSRYQYYLETLKKIDVGEDHIVLQELCKTDIANTPYSSEKLLGHAVIEILIDRSAKGVLSPTWQRTILTIAGDPRVPRSNPTYQKWWDVLGEARVAHMRGWLSRFDLALFLEALEQSAKDSRNDDMQRMFESRKIFMEGLLNLGIVSDSRLFLSDYAVRYLNRHYETSELPDFARVTSNETSMIYLNLSGKLHMIEGSHSFKLKLFKAIPDSVTYLDFRTKIVKDSEIRMRLKTQYVNQFGSDIGFLELVHDVHLNWQNKALNFLREARFDIPSASLIPQKRYREYKEKYGAS